MKTQTDTNYLLAMKRIENSPLCKLMKTISEKRNATNTKST